jgi:DNA-binding beta-propeller fold protein YncE
MGGVRARAVAIAVCAMLLAGVAAAASERSGQRDTAVGLPAPSMGANADRFLDLTLDGSDATAPGSADALLASVGKSPELDGVPRTPAGWAIRPAGRQVEVLRFPLGLAASPDGASVVVSSDSGGVQGLTVIDAASLTAAPVPAANLFMGVAVTGGGQVFASGGNADRVFRWQLIGPVAVPLDLTEAQPIPVHNAMNGLLPSLGIPSPLPALDGIDVPGYPGGMVLAGNRLYVAGTVSEPPDAAHPCPGGQAACARVTIIDPATSTVLGRPAVGLDAFGLAVDTARQRLYVSNWADEAGRGGSSGGTVSVVDISDPATAQEIAVVPVGHHPSALQLSADGSTLFVANTNDDTISVLDVAGAVPVVRSTESVAPLSGVPVGAHPDAFALSPDGRTLFVALAGLNAVELRDGRTGSRLSGEPLYIPTGWYPSALAVTGDASSYRLWVTNAKGSGFGPGANGSVFLQGTKTGGSVTAIDLPVSDEQVREWTEQTRENDLLDRAPADACAPADGVVVSEVLCPPGGQRSPIRHVVYIVTENKTFDQYFGDVNLTGGEGFDADPALALYGAPVTPNHHALATRYSLNDRFFSDAEVSVTGHAWTSAGIATDHNERTWPADYDEGVRGNHGGGDALRPGIGGPAGGLAGAADDELQDAEGGAIFEAFVRAGATPPSDDPGNLSLAIYGERTALESGDMNTYKAPGWKDGDLRYFDSCRAAQFVDGVAPNGPVPEDAPQAPSVPVVGAVTINDCEGRTLPPQFNLAHWTDVHDSTGRDVMPSLIYMSLPVNHTMGANLGSPTPQSMVADNDFAIGMIVEALSRSPFWGSTAVFLTEDDTQIAADHVSSLRDYLQVISPWARPGANHQWGSMPALLRTIETIFDVEPFTVNDRIAIPQHGAFVARLDEGPDLTPYDAVAPLVPFGLNEPGLVSEELAALSGQLDLSTYDLADEATLNGILYALARGTTFADALAFLDRVGS